MRGLRLRNRLLLGAAAVGALALPYGAFAQSAATLDEVVVQGTVPAPRPRPAPTRRPAPATPIAPAAPVVTTPVTPPALSVVATTPVTGIGFDRNKIPAMVQTLTAQDFYRTHSPSVLVP